MVKLFLKIQSRDTLSISNVVPFGEDNSSVYITGDGPWDLARAWLFRPGFQPVRVILPDNAWELGIFFIFCRIMNIQCVHLQDGQILKAD